MHRINALSISLRWLIMMAALFSQVVSAKPVETAAVALYIGLQEDTSAFTQTLSDVWREENITVVKMPICTKPREVSAQIACLREQMQSARLRDRKVIWMLSGEYSNLAAAALQNPKGLQDLSSVVLLGSDKAQLPLTSSEQGAPAWNLLIVNLSTDSAKQIQHSRQLAQQFRAVGVPSWFTLLIPPPNDAAFRRHAHPVLSKMVAYQVFGEIDTPYNIPFKAESFWQDPPLNNSGFLQNEDFADIFPVDPLLFRTVETFYQSEPFFLKQWPFKTYKALDLMKWREALPKEKQARFVAFKNPKGHHFFLDLDRYGRYQPVIVYQLDDETNLYRLARFYKTKQYYSWLPEKGGPGENDMYVEPLGAFLHFLKPLPAQYEIPRLQYTAIVYESIEFTDQDPFEPLSGMSYPLYRIASRNCISCHRIDGVGGSAGHLDAFTLQKKEGFALPLRAYDQAVLREFFFDQQNVANRIGVRPNFVQPEVASELMEWLRLPSTQP